MREEPASGFEPLLEELLEPVLSDCPAHGIKVLGNFGAANPAGACQLVAELAAGTAVPMRVSPRFRVTIFVSVCTSSTFSAGKPSGWKCRATKR